MTYVVAFEEGQYHYAAAASRGCEELTRTRSLCSGCHLTVYKELWRKDLKTASAAEKGRTGLVVGDHGFLAKTATISEYLLRQDQER